MKNPTYPKNSVRILPEPLINKISAGEVVERPASVVKELLENSIDAGSTNIHITLENGGKDLISILDDGCGMNEVDLKLAVERHATSKIFHEKDLFNIKTLGFRGEALAAIASVSHFELLTCDDEKNGAHRIFLKGGIVDKFGKVGFPKGTKITIKRLFFNTPARLKFLKTNNTELHHIQQHIVQKALANPHIHFRLTSNSRLLLNLPGGQKLGDRIQKLFGEEFKNNLMMIKHEETYLKFSGFISIPSKPKTSRRWQYIFVNERNIKSLAVNHGIYSGFGTFLGKNQHPIFFLNLKINPTEIDVNVHPAKTEIRFRNDQLIHTILMGQISRALKDGASRRFFGREHSHLSIPIDEITGQIEIPIEKDLISKSKNFVMDSPSSKKNPTQVLPNLDRSFFEKSDISDLRAGYISLMKSKYESEIKNLCILSPLREISQKVRLLGKLNNIYIIAEKNQGLLIINIRILHAYLVYNFYKEALNKKDVPVKTFQAPALIEFSAKESTSIQRSIENFELLGFSINHFGGSTFALNSIPNVLNTEKVDKVIKEILDHIILIDNSILDNKIINEICNIVSKHSAIVEDYELTLTEMEILIAQWEFMGSPMKSQNDITIVLELTRNEFEKRFKKE